MLLAIDIGNTSIDIGLFEGWALRSFKLGSRPAKSPAGYAEAIGGLLGGKRPEGVVLCSVVPALTQAVARGAKEATGKDPMVVDHSSNHGLVLDVINPAEVGADRIAECSAAAEMFGTPVAVVSFGTATTVGFVGEGGVFRGGAILPGLSMMARSLAEGTARLPEVAPAWPESPLGRDTAGSILSGIIYGTAGAVERIISEAEALEGAVFKVVVTGGAHEEALPAMRRADHVEPALTLKGLKLIYERS